MVGNLSTILNLHILTCVARTGLKPSPWSEQRGEEEVEKDKEQILDSIDFVL